MTTPNADYTKEIRFAVVMYGGVSLAIYINGVAQELYRLVRSTAKCERDETGKQALISAKTIDGTERVYRKLSHLMADEVLLKEYRDYVTKIENHRRQVEKEERDPAARKAKLAERIKSEGDDPLEVATNDDATLVHTRFIVDILSGTSAGGINAIYLAKAFANDQNIDQLKELWVNEGDIGLLLNDKHSVTGLNLRNQTQPQSLLNSRRMYFKLLKSLTDMGKDPPFESPYVDELDLFITTTDIAGVPIPLRLLDGVVYERRHRNVFHFKYAKAEILGDEYNDFRWQLNPFLAFAARCTSSFPFAFEPMRLCDIDEVLNLFGEYRNDSLCKSDSEVWQRFFQEELDPQTGTPVKPPRFAQRSFGDGGYLDNKPFSYATETLMHRQSDVPVDRKLIYIEPSPEHPEDELTVLDKPNALQNVKAAVLDLPTYETIREDLQRVLDRNKLIERVNRISSGIERDVNGYIPNAVKASLEGMSIKPQPQAPGTGPGMPPPSRPTDSGSGEGVSDWYNAGLVEMVNSYSRYILPYRRLRISSVTDDIARLFTRLSNFDEDSDQFLAIRSLVRIWRDSNYGDYKGQQKQTVNAFLSDYDLAYRLRRLNSTRSKVDQLTLRDKRLLKEIEEHSESLTKVTDIMPDRADGSEEWKAIVQKYPQILLQSYGKKLRPIIADSSTDFLPILRFIKLELNEVFKLLRMRGRLLRSRQSKPPEKTSPAEIAAVEEATKGNPLLPLIAATGITPADLNEILGTPAEGSATRKAGPSAVNPDEDEEEYIERAKALLKRSDKAKRNLEATADKLKEQLEEVFTIARHQCNALLDPEHLYTHKEYREPYVALSQHGEEMLKQNPDLLTSEAAIAVRGFLGYYYHNFDDYDQIRFPIFYEADVGESDVVEVIRISPEDATSLIDERLELKNSSEPDKARRKLAGVSLHHFGAFLDRTWRQNDIMWGRLDGVERLVAGILPGRENELVRQELITEAHLAILKEELKPQSLSVLEGVMSEALLRASGGLAVDDALSKSLQPLKDAPVKTGIDQIVRLRVADDELVKFVGESYQVNRHLEPRAMLNSISRATQIIGKMFEQMAEDNGLEGKRLTWIARLGKIFWGLVEVAVPNSILHLLFTHWLKLLYLFEALMLIGGTLTGKTQVQQFGLLAFALTLATNIAVFFLHDEMLVKRSRLKVFKIIVIVLGIFVFLIGVVALAGLIGIEPVWNRMSGVHGWVTQPSAWRHWWPVGLAVVLILFALRDNLKAAWYRYTGWLAAFRGDKEPG